MSGESNVAHWLRRHGLDPVEGLVKAILGAAKKKNHVLTQAEIDSVIDQYRREAPTGPA